MACKKITIGHLFPDLLNLYGDRGNLLTLQSRLTKRDFAVDVKEFLKTDALCFEDLDILLIGGGSNREQGIACGLLRAAQPQLLQFVESGGVVLAVCGGFQMLGRSYQLEEESVAGLSVLDMETEAGEKRFIGNVIVSTDITGEELFVAGFENHIGRTRLGNCKPFGKVLCGHGNNGEDSTCGAVYKNVLGTYLHGPLLPKNPKLADHLIKTALERKYGEEISLLPLDDQAENEAHDYIIQRFYQ